MGIYLNPGNDAFRETLNSEIYVDKSGLIAFTNRVAMTEQKYLCVSRPRRFGKSVTAKMLAAYYDRSCNSGSLFDKLLISGNDSYERYLNSSYVLYLDIAWFHMTSAGTEGVADVLDGLLGLAAREARVVVFRYDQVHNAPPHLLIFINEFPAGNHFHQIYLPMWENTPLPAQSHSL